MNREFLAKYNLGSDQIDEILDEVGKIKAKTESVKETKQQQIDELKRQIEEMTAELSELKEVDADQLQDRIHELEGQLKTNREEYESKVKKITIESTLREELLKSGARTPNAVRALLDMDKVSLGKDGQVFGLSEQIESLQKSEDTAYLFKSEEDSKPTFRGAKRGDSDDDRGWDPPKDRSEWTYEDYVKEQEQKHKK